MVSTSDWNSKQLARLLEVGEQGGCPPAERSPAWQPPDADTHGDSSRTDRTPPPLSQALGGYELLGQIGRGAMGAVFKARQKSMDRVVALKVLPQRLARNKEFVARFLREARSAGRLTEPSIVQAFDAGEADGYYYIAMEYIDGPCLDDHLQTAGALPERQALEIARDIARALGYAHAVGLIHRDVKPANILMTSAGEAKLADLGLARESIVGGDSSLTNVGVALGTPDYMAPEQVRGDADIDGRCDVYSLGGTLYHLLVGRPPFKGGTRAEVMSKHLTEPVPDARQANPQVSPAANAIIKKAMAKQRDARYADASEMLADIDAALAGRRVSAPAAGAGPTQSTALSRARARRSRPISRKLTYAGAVAAAVLLFGLSIALFAGSKDRLVARPSTDTPAAQVPTTGPGSAGPDSPALGPKPATVLKEAKAALVAARNQAAALTGAEDYDGAIALLNNLPGRFSSVLGDSVEQTVERLKAEADARVQAAFDEAGKLGAAGKFPEALARLERLESLRYAPASPKIQQQRARLVNEQKQWTDAERQRTVAPALAGIEKLLDQIDVAAREDPARAKELAEAALKDPALKPAGEALTAAARIGTIVGTFGERRRADLVLSLKRLVGQRVVLETKDGKKGGKVKSVTDTEIAFDKSFKIGDIVRERPDEVVLIADLAGDTLKEHRPRLEPRTPDECIAVAILAMASGDAATMAAALQGATEHPLHKRYAARLETAQAEHREYLAKVAWRPLALYAAKSRLQAAEIKKGSALLDAFEGAHGTTRFAASQSKVVLRLRSLLNPTFTKWPFGSADARRRQKEAAAALGVPVIKTVDLGRGVELELVLIPAGEFMMGTLESAETIAKRSNYKNAGAAQYTGEQPQHRVRITRPFYIGKHEVTNGQWQAVTGKRTKTLSFRGMKHPADTVSWNECQDFLNKLNDRVKGLGAFTFPTEAEWEFACRAGTATAFYTGRTISTDVANYLGNTGYDNGPKGTFRNKTIPVGSFRPNAFGLYDMHGNAEEWCADWYGEDYYRSSPKDDPKGPPSGRKRVIRGGSYRTTPAHTRSSSRAQDEPQVGYYSYSLRVVLRIPPKKDR